jgi:hypothetical protein
MAIMRIFPNPLADRTSGIISNLGKYLLLPKNEYRKESVLEFITDNFGFVIIGLMFIGALVWTALMCG